MDYGPFGFLDNYHPLMAKWTGSGEHFGFMNQPSAGYANFAVLVESVLPVVEAYGGDVDKFRNEILEKASDRFRRKVDTAMQTKLGLDLEGKEEERMTEEADELWDMVEPVLRTARADWTLFWRQLTYVAEKYSPAADSGEDADYEAMLNLLMGDDPSRPGQSPFYDAPTSGQRKTLLAWIQRWHKALTRAYSLAVKDADGVGIVVTPPEERMRLSNPKYVLREWMLVDAYTMADKGKFASGDYSGVNELFDLIRDPYAEGTPDQHEKFYRRASDDSLRAGGTAFMS